MKKTKDGKVIASLTEVKNKTGDIFALADEYGEVILTSYNKPRYKLIKLNVSALLEEEAPTPKAKRNEEVKETAVKAEKKNDLHTEKPQEEEKMIDNSFTINAWDRNSGNEQEFINKATKPLI